MGLLIAECVYCQNRFNRHFKLLHNTATIGFICYDCLKEISEQNGRFKKKDIDNFLYRQDDRSANDFILNIIFYEAYELYISLKFLVSYNKSRKKLGAILIPWGNHVHLTEELVTSKINKITIDNCLSKVETKIILEKAAIKQVAKSDFIYIKLADNSPIGQNIVPLEIQVSSSPDIEYCFIKQTKLNRRIENKDNYFTHKQHLLFIIGDIENGKAQYTTLTPSFLDNLKNTEPVPAACFNNKPSYRFRRQDIKWNLFNKKKSQNQVEMLLEGN